MMHARPYRPALPLTEVEACLTAGRGRTFDAAVVDAGLAMLRDGT
jgi:HD-GYP domain-containing protein (c-di-GMP phosphodiesterase class II)